MVLICEPKRISMAKENIGQVAGISTPAAACHLLLALDWLSQSSFYSRPFSSHCSFHLVQSPLAFVGSRPLCLSQPILAVASQSVPLFYNPHFRQSLAAPSVLGCSYSTSPLLLFLIPAITRFDPTDTSKSWLFLSQVGLLSIFVICYVLHVPWRLA